MDILIDIVKRFGPALDPDFEGHKLLELYQASGPCVNGPLGDCILCNFVVLITRATAVILFYLHT